MKISDLLPFLERSYRSIDLCISCVHYEDKWVNLFTLMKFSYQDTKSLNEQILEKFNLINELSKGKKFRIYRKQYPISDFDALSHSFSQGILKIDDTMIHYQSYDVRNSDISLYRNRTPNEWSSFSVHRDSKSQLPNKLDSFFESMKGEVILYGVKDIFHAIQHFFDYSEFGPTNVQDFTIIAPVYAKIEKIELQNKKIIVTIKHHKNLDGFVFHYRRYVYTNKDDTLSGPTVYNPDDGQIKEHVDFKICNVETEEVDITNKHFEGNCEISLFYKPLSVEVSNFHKNVIQLISEKKLLDSNPLAKIFAKFCSIDDLSKLLSNPSKISLSGFQLSDSDNFERIMQWLFTLHGFQAIWLGRDHEIIQDLEGRPAGSADLICYNKDEKVLAVVSCKTGVPEAKDISLIKNLADKFKTTLDDLGIKLAPIIISSANCSAIKETANKSGVGIIDANDLIPIVNALYQGPPNPGSFLQILHVF